MDVYKYNIQSDGSLDKIKLRIVIRGDLQNKEIVGDTWSPTASMRTLKYFLVDAPKHKARVHQLDFIGAFLQAKVLCILWKIICKSNIQLDKTMFFTLACRNAPMKSN